MIDLPHSDGGHLSLTLKVWRQDDADAEGRFETYQVGDINPDMSFLEMLDCLNEQLVQEDREPVAFDHDCREGICGTCGVMINGMAHGPLPNTTTCQLRMRQFRDGDTLVLEPWRAKGFPIVRDLVCDRSSFDRIQQVGGYVSVSVGSAPDANAVSVPKKIADAAMNSAACIGCGACVASCKNAAAHLFTAAKVSHLSLLPQGAAERKDRVRRMVAQMDEEGFGACSNTNECQAACPANIAVTDIARLNREYAYASLGTSD